MKVRKKSYRAAARTKKLYARSRRNTNQVHDNSSTNSESLLGDTDKNAEVVSDNSFIQFAVQEMDYVENNSNEFQISIDDVFSKMAIDEEQIDKFENSSVAIHDESALVVYDGIFLPKFNIVLQNKSIKQLKKFDKSCSNIPWNTCINCGRSFPNLTIKDNKCLYCNKNSHKWTRLNGMDPGAVPSELSCLTDIEALVIAQVHPIISVHRYRGGQHLYRGNVINFSQDITSFVKVLPHIPSDIPYIIIFHRKFKSGTLKCVARPDKIRSALLWLKNNNKWYANIEISEENLSLYRSDGDISESLKKLSLELDDDEDKLIEEQLNSFVPGNTTCKQNDLIYNKLNLPYPTLNSKPINEFSKDGYISKAFPVLFPYGTADFSDFHNDDSITFVEYCKFLMQYKDRRFAQDYRLRYFLYNTHLRHQLLSQSSIYIKRGHWENDNADLFKDAIRANPKILDEIVSFSRNIRSTPAYWKQKCGELLSMCRQLKSPHVFFTLSAADYHWPDPFKLISPDKEFTDLTEKERRELMHNNPIISGYFFQYRLDQFTKLVIKPLYKVVDIWYRLEWQSRGSPHAHGVLWLSDVPQFDEKTYSENDLTALKEYFDSFVFAITPEVRYGDVHPSQKKFSDLTESEQEDDLIHLITHVQRHTTCGIHCLRRNIKTQKISCRYSFPCDLQEYSDINDKEGYLRYYPKRNDPLVQRYSDIIIKGWRANHDFSPICSSLAVIYYIAKYIAKRESTSKTYEDLIKSLSKASDDSLQLKPIISKLFIQSQGDRDISAQEVCHLLMGWPIVHCSRVFVNLNLHTERWDNLTIEGSKVKINKTSMIDIYRFRPNKVQNDILENVSLLEFTKNFYTSKNKYFKHRKERIVRVMPIINLIPHSVNNEAYYQQQCLLHIPFRCEVDSLLSTLGSNVSNTWMKLYHQYQLNDIDNDTFNDVPEDDSEDLDIADNGIRQTLEEVNCGLGNFVNDDTIGRRLQDISHNWKESGLYLPTLDEALAFLQNYKSQPLDIPQHECTIMEFSVDQKNVLALVDEQIDICSQLNSNIKPQFHQCIVQGKAGSGKSTLIQEIVRRVRHKLGYDSIRVCAPTGAAALNINGSTIHSEFKLPMNVQKIESLSGTAANKFENDTKSLKFVIIDEMSMIGAQRLWQLNCRMSEINPESPIPFGGIYIYFFGDFRQLPPVRDTPLYCKNSSTVNGQKGLELFQSIKKKIELTSTHRQAEDKRFAEIVDRIGFGEVTQNDYQLLASRNINILNKDELDTFSKAIYLCSTNNHVKEANLKHLEKLNTRIAEIRAINKPNCKLRPHEEEAGGLSDVLYLSVGCRVMLTKNLWTPSGLVNGALGTVTAIIYDNETAPPELPLYILVKFDKYFGPTFNLDSVPIVPESAQWTLDNINYYRKQYPLTLTYASSIHKGQGLTIPKVIINLGDSEFACGISYVALTRARKLTDIVFNPFFPYKRLSRLGVNNTMKARIEFIRSFSNT